MRIGIDVSQIIYETGVSLYTKELVINLFKIDKEEAVFLPPVVTNDTKTIPLAPKKKKQHIFDYSIQMRTDDPTMISIHKQNLRPV